MKKTHKFLVLVALAAILLTLGYVHRAAGKETQADAQPEAAQSLLRHDQLVYTYALEWCESRGIETAINPKDRDNTPSYYSWQWKPSTFRYYGTRYGVLATSTTDAELKTAMADYGTQRQVLEAMVNDAGHINWNQQFPDCTKKIGLPPKISPKAL